MPRCLLGRHYPQAKLRSLFYAVSLGQVDAFEAKSRTNGGKRSGVFALRYSPVAGVVLCCSAHRNQRNACKHLTAPSGRISCLTTIH